MAETRPTTCRRQCQTASERDYSRHGGVAAGGAVGAGQRRPGDAGDGQRLRRTSAVAAEKQPTRIASTGPVAATKTRMMGAGAVGAPGRTKRRPRLQLLRPQTVTATAGSGFRTL